MKTRYFISTSPFRQALRNDRYFPVFQNVFASPKKYFFTVGYDIRTTFGDFFVKKSQGLLSLLTHFSLLYLFRRNFHLKIVQFELFTKSRFGCIIQELSAAPTPQPRTTVFITLWNINLMISSAHGIDLRLCFFLFLGALPFLFFCSSRTRKIFKILLIIINSYRHPHLFVL